MSQHRKVRISIDACVILYVLAWAMAGSLVVWVMATSGRTPEPSPRWEIVTPHGNIETGVRSWSKSTSALTAEPSGWPTPGESLALFDLPTSTSIRERHGAPRMHVPSGRLRRPVHATERPSAGMGSPQQT
jgi:hypothetical protein